MVVVVDGLAASGGYIAALAADHIVAQETSLVGSIGVLFQYPNVTDLLKTIGVKVEEIKSSPLKAAPNGFEPTSPEARAAIEAIVTDSYAWFRGMVKARRQLDDATLGARRRRPRLHRPAGDRAQARRRARRRAGGDRLAGEGEEHRSEDAGARLSAARRFGDLPFLHTAVVATPRRASAWARSRGGWRSGARCRRSSVSTLTVSWPFGTLQPRTEAERFVPAGQGRQQR